VTEVERPKRRHLHRSSKSDSRDAESAARTVLAGETAGEPKSADGRVEMIRALRTVTAAPRSEVQNAGRQPDPGLAGDGTARTPPAFARTLDEGTRYRGRTLPSRRCSL
jgi:hypothetical protein